MDYHSMTDDEIRSRLIEAGLPVGPIVDSTRKVYIRKLQRLAGDIAEVSVEADDDDKEEEDEEIIPELIPSPVTRGRPMTAKTRSPVSSTGDAAEMRQRKVQQKKLDVPITKEIQEPSGGGFCTGVLMKFLIFTALCIIIAVVLGVTGQIEPMNLIGVGN